MFQIVAYRTTVYRTGLKSLCLSHVNFIQVVFLLHNFCLWRTQIVCTILDFVFHTIYDFICLFAPLGKTSSFSKQLLFYMLQGTSWQSAFFQNHARVRNDDVFSNLDLPPWCQGSTIDSYWKLWKLGKLWCTLKIKKFTQLFFDW